MRLSMESTSRPSWVRVLLYAARRIPLYGTVVWRHAFSRLRLLVCLAGLVGVVTVAIEVFPPTGGGNTGVPKIVVFGPEEPLNGPAHATKVLLKGEIESFGSNTHWEILYSESALTSCKEGTPGGSGIVEFPSEKGDLFTVELHHLTPETHYYAVLCAENASGSVTATTGFTTTAVGYPEIVGLTFFGGVQDSIGTTLA